MKRVWRAVLWACGIACAMQQSVAQAQTYPVKPIRIILPFATGGTDFVTRWLSLKLSPALGQQIVPEPRTGAGGNIAHEAVARAAPDGYTLLMAAPPLTINPALNPGLSYDPFRDLTPIALLATIPNVMVVHPSVPATSVKELVALARKHPGKLAYASGGVGSAPHLASELFRSLTGIRLVHVPYKGAAIGLIGAMSGEVDMVVSVAPAVVPYVRDRRMRALAVLDTKRVASLPEVPTTTEAGIPELIAVNWYILLAPAGTPRPIIERLNAESIKVMQQADTRERFAAMGAEPTSSTPEQALEFLRADYARWSRLIKQSGIRAE